MLSLLRSVQPVATRSREALAGRSIIRALASERDGTLRPHYGAPEYPKVPSPVQRLPPLPRDLSAALCVRSQRGPLPEPRSASCAQDAARSPHAVSKLFQSFIGAFILVWPELRAKRNIPLGLPVLPCENRLEEKECLQLEQINEKSGIQKENKPTDCSQCESTPSKKQQSAEK
ncbi:unnamed protein product [Colias eurytheme]|nr:unnamed protein product [Colias eurytheme]